MAVIVKYEVLKGARSLTLAGILITVWAGELQKLNLLSAREDST